MKRISDEKIAESAVVCWEALEEHERRSLQLVAQAQLEADIKATDNMAEITPEEARSIIWIIEHTGAKVLTISQNVIAKLKSIAEKK